LWKFNVSTDIGRQVLADMYHNIKNGQSEYISDINLPDDHMFAVDIIPLISLPHLQALAIDAYVTDNKEIITILRKIADTTNDDMLFTACVFWKLQIPVSPGKRILDHIKNTEAYKTQPVLTDVYSSDMELFIHKIQPLIPCSDFKDMAASAYFANNIQLIPVILSSYSQNANRYLKAVLALWKYKVNTHTGEIILKRINDYCNQKKNKYYIDLCIYKDIYHAIKTKNVSN
jgi:hypothetical protein